MSEGPLAGQAAIVTGAGQGIGRGIALTLAADGADVAIVDVNGKTAGDVAGEVQALGRRALPLEVDVSDFSAVERGIALAVETFGRLDVLVNNVGWTPNESFVDSAPDTWHRIIALNYVSTLNCTRAALAVMVPARRGRIVSIASDAARIGTPREAVYAGAKGAVIAFSKALAAEVAQHGITVNVVSPATVDTPLLRRILTPDQIQRREKANPMGRLGQPEDIAGAVAFFASPRAAYVTGQVLSVNGGIARVG